MNQLSRLMGFSAEDFQRYDGQARKVLVHEWLLALVFCLLLTEYYGMSPKEVAVLLRFESNSTTTFINEDGTIHPGAVLEALQQEFSEERQGKSILDIFVKPKLPNSDKHLQAYVDIQNSQHSEERDALRSFLYIVRIISKQLEGPLSTMNTKPFEKVCGIWIFPHSPASRRGKVSRYSITGQLNIDNKADPKENAIRDMNMAEWFHIYLGNPTEEELQNNLPGTNQEKLVDLLEIVVTDKIETDRKPQLLQDRHQVHITDKMKEDLKNMTIYETMANTCNEAVRKIALYEDMASNYNEALRKIEVYENEKAAQDLRLAEQDAMIASLQAELAKALQK